MSLEERTMEESKVRFYQSTKNRPSRFKLIIFTELRNFSLDFVFIIIRTDKNKTLNAFCLQLSKWSDLFDVPDQTLLALFCITFWDHLNLLCKWIWKFVVHSFIRLVKKNITRIESVVFCYSESCQAQFTWSSTWSDQRGAMSLYVCDIFVPPPLFPGQNS